MKRTIRFAAPLLAAAFVLAGTGLSAPVGEEAVAETTVSAANFNSEEIVLTFGVMSDVHISFGTNPRTFRNSLGYLKENYDLDGVLITGDLTQFGREDEAHQLIRGYKEVFDPEEVAFMACYGNHDTFMYKNLDPEGFYEVFRQEDPDIYKYDVGALDQIKAGNRWIQLEGTDGKDYNVVCVEYDVYGSATAMTDETRAWLEETLTTIERDYPDQYIFLTGHAPIADTIAWSWSYSDNISGSTTMDAILKNHPHVVYFSGHTHGPEHCELGIRQTGYTQVHVGGETDLAIDSLAHTDRHSYSVGEVVEVDSSGAVRITRLDFFKRAAIRDPWTLLPCGEDGYLDRYQLETRTENNAAPYFEQGAAIKAEPISSTGLKLTFDRAKDDMLVLSYGVTAKDAAGRELSFTLTDESGRCTFSPSKYSNGFADDFYDWPTPEEMPAQKVLLMRFPQAMTYPMTISIVAYDEFGAYDVYADRGFVTDGVSDPLTVTVQDPSEQDTAAAAAFDNAVSALGDASSLTKESGARLKEVRAQYAALSTLAKSRTTKERTLFALESEYARKVASAPAGDLPLAGTMQTFFASAHKGSVTEAERGVDLKWNSGTKNCLISLAAEWKLDGLKLHFAGLDVKTVSSTPSFAILLSNERGDKWDDNECALLKFDLNNGEVRYGDKLYLGRSQLFTLDRLGGGAFTISFAVKGNALDISIETDAGTETYTLSDAYLSRLGNFTDHTKGYVSFTPWSVRQTMSVNLMTIESAK